MRLPFGLCAGALTVALLTACGPPEPAAPARRAARPIGAPAYREILLREAQLDWTPETLSRVARAEAVFVRRRMDRLARQLGFADGRSATTQLARDHAPTAEAVLDAYRQAVEKARGFVENRGLVSVPAGRPLQVVATPATLTAGRYPFVAYLGDKLAVTLEGAAALSQHCRTCIPPLVVHEAYPGHHVAFLVRRSPRPDADSELRAMTGQHVNNRFHSEGWAQYGEILMLEAGFYDGDPAGELGAWNLVLLRLYRAALDAELHGGSIDGGQLVRTLVEELGVLPATAQADLAHHLEEPAMKASYFVGLLQILSLRAELERRTPDFDRRAFHDRLLAWPLPWPEVARRFFAENELLVPEDGKILARAFGEGL